MSLHFKKEKQQLSVRWNENNDVRLEYESKLRDKFGARLKYYYELALNDFKEFFTNMGFNFFETTRFLEASINDLKYQLSKGEPKPIKHYDFQIAELDDIRKIYTIVIQPESEIYYPRLNKLRERPQSVDMLKMDINRIEDEILWLEERIKSMDSTTFIYSYYIGDVKKLDYSTLKKYDSFKAILNILVHDT